MAFAYTSATEESTGLNECLLFVAASENLLRDERGWLMFLQVEQPEETIESSWLIPGDLHATESEERKAAKCIAV